MNALLNIVDSAFIFSRQIFEISGGHIVIGSMLMRSMKTAPTHFTYGEAMSNKETIQIEYKTGLQSLV